MNHSVQHAFRWAAAAIAYGAMGSVAYAGTATATMTNTVVISNNCSITTIGFTTTYDPVVANASTAQTATASVTTICTIGDTPVITLGQGANPASGSTNAVPLRRVSNGATTPTYLNYGLYSDTNHTVVWGNTPASAPGGVVSTGLPAIITIYASIPGGQSGPSGTYTDSVVATVTF